MAYLELPTRTTADTNTPGDINQLQDNFDALLDGTQNFATLSATTVSASTVSASSAITINGATVPTWNVESTSSVASATPKGNYNFSQYNLTALGTACHFVEPSGTVSDGNVLKIRIEGATAYALTWSATGYEEKGATLPATTVAGKQVILGLLRNDKDSIWDCVAKSHEG